MATIDPIGSAFGLFTGRTAAPCYRFSANAWLTVTSHNILVGFGYSVNDSRTDDGPSKSTYDEFY